MHFYAFDLKSDPVTTCPYLFYMTSHRACTELPALFTLFKSLKEINILFSEDAIN